MPTTPTTTTRTPTTTSEPRGSAGKPRHRALPLLAQEGLHDVPLRGLFRSGHAGHGAVVGPQPAAAVGSVDLFGIRLADGAGEVVVGEQLPNLVGGNDLDLLFPHVGAHALEVFVGEPEEELLESVALVRRDVLAHEMADEKGFTLVLDEAEELVHPHE